ncbi:MAG: cell division protein FtsA [Cetobacterium sp.]
MKKNSMIKLALDIGNSKIRFLLGELSENGSKLEVLEYKEIPSRGIKKSIIENPELLSDTIRDGLMEIRAKTGIDIDRVILGVGGHSVTSRTEHVEIVFDEKEISKEDLDGIFSQAERDLVQRGEVVIEKEIYNIRVNNSGIVKNPIGIVGKELQGDVHFIIMDERDLMGLVEVINRAGLEVEHISLNAVAAAKAVLEQEDKHMGVALIDIGEGCTDIIIFKNDKMIYSKSLPLGGMHYVSDLSYLFQISRAEAGDILDKIRRKDFTNGYILVGETKKVTVEDIKNIIDARTGDLINFISKTIEDSGFNGYLGKGIIITGGAILMDEIYDKVSKTMGYAVKRVYPVPIKGLEEVNLGMAVVVGLFLERMEKEYENLKESESSEEELISSEELTLNENLVDLELEEKEDKKKKKKKEKPKKEKKSNGAIEAIKKWISNFV